MFWQCFSFRTENIWSSRDSFLFSMTASRFLLTQVLNSVPPPCLLMPFSSFLPVPWKRKQLFLVRVRAGGVGGGEEGRGEGEGGSWVSARMRAVKTKQTKQHSTENARSFSISVSVCLFLFLFLYVCYSSTPKCKRFHACNLAVAITKESEPKNVQVTSLQVEVKHLTPVLASATHSSPTPTPSTSRTPAHSTCLCLGCRSNRSVPRMNKLLLTWSGYLDKVMTSSIAKAVKVKRREGQLDVVTSFQCDDIGTVQVVRVRVGRFRGDNGSASARERPPAFC